MNLIFICINSIRNCKELTDITIELILKILITRI